MFAQNPSGTRRAELELPDPRCHAVFTRARECLLLFLVGRLDSPRLVGLSGAPLHNARSSRTMITHRTDQLYRAGTGMIE